MTLIELLLLLIIASICGGLGQSLVGYSRGGCLTSIVVGIIGAYLGVLIAREFGLPIIFAIQLGGQSFPIIWSIIGSAVLSFIFGALSKALR
ncbi:MAG: hypothetical protein WBA57_19095 [Elainellaceae cyanobacterium]